MKCTRTVVLALLGLLLVMPHAAVRADGPPEIVRVTPVIRESPASHFYVFGENLKDATAVHFWNPKAEDAETDAAAQDLPGRATLPDTPPAEARKLPIKQAFDQALLVTAATGSVERGLAVVWVENESGVSRPVMVNRAEIWNQSHRVAVPGEHLQVFGRDLSVRFSGNPKIALRHIERDEVFAAAWGSPQAQGMPYTVEYRLDTLLPADLPEGKYELYVHNNTGGPHGWSEPTELEIIKQRDFVAAMANLWNRQGVNAPGAAPAPSNRVTVDVDPFGYGATDATEPIQQAIDDVAGKGGGVVFFPPGVYGISRTLDLKPGVVLQGAGRGATRITVADGHRFTSQWPAIKPARRAGDLEREILGVTVRGERGGAGDWEPYLKSAGMAPLVWLRHRGGLTDLSLEGGPGVGMLALVARTEHDAVSEDVFFNRVNLRNKEKQAIATDGYLPRYHGVTVMSKTRRFTMYDCELISAGTLHMLPAYRHHDVRLLGNHFEVSPRQASINVVIKSVYGAMIEENTFLHGGRSMVSQNGYAHNWVFQNESIGVGRAGNGGEQFMSEYGNATWLGQAASVAGESITLPADADRPAMANIDEHDYFLFICKGRGLGQYRRIASIDGDTVQLAEPWDVMPDGGSTFALLNCTHHNLWVNNTAKEGDGSSPFAYGAAIDNIVAGHYMMDNSGLALHAFKQDMKDGSLRRFGVIAFNQVIGCHARYAAGHDAAFKLWRVSKNPTAHTHIGNEFRHNVALGGVEGAMYQNQYGDFWNKHNVDYIPDLVSGFEVMGAHNIVENNMVNGLPVGVRVKAGVGNAVLRNRIDHVTNTPVIVAPGTSVVEMPHNQQYEVIESAP